jgi:hypothetical protein
VYIYHFGFKGSENIGMHRGVAGWGVEVLEWPPRAAGCKGQQNKKYDFQRLTNFELLRHMKGNSISDCSSLKVKSLH